MEKRAYLAGKGFADFGKVNRTLILDCLGGHVFVSLLQLEQFRAFDFPKSFSQPVHLASMSRMIPNAVRQYGIEKLRPGDALVMNHPYRGGVHLNDVAIIAHFFSGEKLHGHAATIAHHVDIGGYAPGGYCISTEVYQEGIILPPTRLVSEGEIDDDVFNLILTNIRTAWPNATARP